MASPIPNKPKPKVQRMRPSPFHKGSGVAAKAAAAAAAPSRLGKKAAASDRWGAGLGLCMVIERMLM